MCGIACAVTLRHDARPRPDRERLCRMSGLMGHRGPDGEGFWAEPRGRVAFAHRRLSVIDIAGGRQPMCSDDGRIALVFNGEIYNYRELRRVLSDQGVRFHTASDTEVLLRLYERCGREAVHYLRGMFAFVARPVPHGEGEHAAEIVHRLAACSPSPCGTGRATSWCSRGTASARSPCST